MNRSVTRAGAALFLLAGAAAATPAWADAETDAKCAAMAQTQLPGVDLKIATAQRVTDGAPPHCLVSGSFEHRTGADGKPYAIGFSIALPDAWEGRFLVQG